MELCDDEEILPCRMGQVREVSSVQSETASVPGVRRLSRDHQPGTQTVSDSPSNAAAYGRGRLTGHPPPILQ